MPRSPQDASFSLRRTGGANILQLHSGDGLNRLTRERVQALLDAIEMNSNEPAPMIIAGNEKFFSVGADLTEIASLTATAALEFSQLGQRLMKAIESFPTPVCAAISGYCMGGGLDLALACRYRIASPNAVLGHRGAALGLITGWGGTQRLSRLIGKASALHMFVAAEKIDPQSALGLGLIDDVDSDPFRAALRLIKV